MPSLRLATTLAYAREPREQVEELLELERAGLDMVWVPEVYGYDAPTLMGYVAARSERLLIGAGVLPIFTRTPALIAQTAAALDALSGGRCVLGLGSSGPQVIEGFHGVPFERPLGRIRETIEICRTVWRREPLVHRGRSYTLPLPPERGTGLGKPLKLITHPPRERIPIWIAGLRPGSVELAAELAEGWFPIFFHPERVREVWGEALDAGLARRDPALGALEVCAGGICAVGEGEEVRALRDQARPDLALYIGGMGARGRNYYNELFVAFGWEQAAREVQELFLGGKQREAAAALPEDLVEAMTLVGPPAYLRERIAVLAEAGVTVLNLRPVGPDPVRSIATIRELISQTPTSPDRRRPHPRDD